MARLSRRDFLKLVALSSAGMAMSAVHPLAQTIQMQASRKPNILIFVFDAMAARHLSLYGYERETTPHLAEFASRANVYHSHYSTANFTSSGTASLLSGLYPWKHRAIQLGGLVDRNLADQSIFNFIGNEYRKVAFTQNIWADLLLRQYEVNIDFHVPASTFSHKSKQPILSGLFPNDHIISHYAFDEFLSYSQKDLNPLPGSLLLGSLGIMNQELTRELELPSEDYPLGMPSNALFYYFQNREVYDGLGAIIKNAISPWRPLFGYFHLFAPHGPYAPRQDFVNIFPAMKVTPKAEHPLSIMEFDSASLYELRTHYDEYVANVDAEFGRLMAALAESGLLDNTYIVITSDHGQVFERGEFGHGTLLLYEPVIHIPLLISAPGQTERLDIYSPTSSVDIVPTLLTIAGQNIPSDLDGLLLPGLGGQEDFRRSIYSLEAKQNSASRPLETATLSLTKERQKLIYYAGYKKYSDVFEMYNLDEDQEEVNDLFLKDTVTAARLKEELLDTLDTANSPFSRA